MRTLLRPIIAAAILLGIPAALAGCGAGDVIDPAKTGIAVRYDVEEATGAKVAAVDCPDSVAAEPGNRFTCQVRTREGDRALAELVVRTDRGDLRLLRLRKP